MGVALSFGRGWPYYLAADNVVETQEFLDGLRTKEKAALLDFARPLAKVIGQIDTLTPAQLLRNLLDASGYRTRLTSSPTPENHERLANLDELGAYVAHLSSVPGRVGLGRALEEIALETPQDGMAEGSVAIVTMHQAKGLEWPIVFLAGMEDGLFPNRRALEDGKERIDEERRLAYVGMTRAMDRLYLTRARLRHRYDGSPQPTRPSRYLDDIPPELAVQLSSPAAAHAPLELPGHVQPALKASNT